jgi:hypothetical protein
MGLKLIIGCWLASVLCVDPASSWAAAARNDFTLVRNSNNASGRIARNDLKDMFIGRKKVWPQGPVVQAVLSPKGSPALKWLAETVLGVPEQVLTAKIRQEVFKGELHKPIVVASDGECLTAVANHPGAVGVIHTSAAKSLPAGVAILTVY